MKSDVSKILDKCIENIQAGYLTVDDCLAQYPALRDELEPMLSAANILIENSDLKPNPNTKKQSLEKLLAAVNQKRWEAGIERAALLDKKAIRKQTLAKKPGLLVRLALVAGFCFALSGVAVAFAEQSLPGSPLYPLKIAIEKAKIRLATTEEKRRLMYLQAAEHRLEELEKIDPSNENYPKLVNELESNIEKSGKDIQEATQNKEENAQSGTKDKIENNKEIRNSKRAKKINKGNDGDDINETVLSKLKYIEKRKEKLLKKQELKLKAIKQESKGINRTEEKSEKRIKNEQLKDLNKKQNDSNNNDKNMNNSSRNNNSTTKIKDGLKEKQDKPDKKKSQEINKETNNFRNRLKDQKNDNYVSDLDNHDLKNKKTNFNFKNTDQNLDKSLYRKPKNSKLRNLSEDKPINNQMKASLTDDRITSESANTIKEQQLKKESVDSTVKYLKNRPKRAVLKIRPKKSLRSKARPKTKRSISSQINNQNKGQEKQKYQIVTSDTALMQ